MYPNQFYAKDTWPGIPREKVVLLQETTLHSCTVVRSNSESGSYNTKTSLPSDLPLMILD